MKKIFDSPFHLRPSHLNTKGKRKMERTVLFKKNQIQMAGVLFLPDDFNENTKYPALVVSSPAGVGRY